MLKMFFKSFNLFKFQQYGFATKMRGTVTKNNKDSPGKRLGLKKFGGEEIRQNQIILRQRGFRYKPGENVHFGKDHTIHSSKEGIVQFSQDPWSKKRKVSVHVVEKEIPNRKLFPPRPFMYHPELYPELAKNNITTGPIPMRPARPGKVKFVRGPEITLLNSTSANNESLDNNNDYSQSQSNNTLQGQALSIQKLSQEARKQDKDMYASRYIVEPILREITRIGITHLTANKEKQLRDEVRKGMAIFEDMKAGNEIDYTKIHTDSDDESYNMADQTSPEHWYRKEVRYSNNLQTNGLREMMKTMQDKNMLGKNIDLRALPVEKMMKKVNRFEQNVVNNHQQRYKKTLESLEKSRADRKKKTNLRAKRIQKHIKSSA